MKARSKKYAPQEQDASTEAGTSALAPFISAVSLAWAAEKGRYVTIESSFWWTPTKHPESHHS